NKFIRKGEINPEEILAKEDITEQVEEVIVGIKDRIDNMLNVMKTDVCPDVKISTYCKDPYDCPLEDYWWGILPKSSAFNLYGGGNECFQLFEDGFVHISDIPHEYKLTDKQRIQYQCELKNKVYVQKEGIKQFLNTLEETLYYLDFETFNVAIPLFDGMKPYQQIPFQWSLQIDDGKEITPFKYLADGEEDPRSGFLKTLKVALGSKGSIIVFNQSFEIGRLKELAEAFPEQKKWVDSVILRIVDLIVPFRNFDYYNPKQKGSCSIKDVLPAITGKDYSHLEIADGATASLSYLNMIYTDGEDCREDLLKYCKLNTEAMVWIVDELRKIVK
ncbi:MAG: DUF2779 domain-containing protein, partial [Nanoarchaeota archaeon]|nr:DUF2779 domain-containing protein [Nanoarchaeota archaeon]